VLCLLALSFACGEDRVVRTLPPGYREDVFAQEAASRIDVLWVIDNSASMQPHQEALAASLSRFIELFSRGLVDYRIAVTTTDARRARGEFLGSPAIVHPSLPDPVAAFQRNVKVGTGGKGYEQGLEAVRLAVERERGRAEAVLAERKACADACDSLGESAPRCREDCANRHQPEFMRPEAHLYVVFVTDEEDQSIGDVRYFQRHLKGALGAGNEDAVGVAAICGDAAVSSCGAERGGRYLALAEGTGGIVASICDPAFERHLERRAFAAFGLKRKFVLSRRPDPTTLRVTVRYRCDTPAEQMTGCAALTDSCAGQGPEHLGFVCEPALGEPNGWVYEASTASLLFHGTSVPGLRSAVVASYQEGEEP